MDNLKPLLAEIPFLNLWHPLFPTHSNARQNRKRTAPTSSSTGPPSSPPFKDLGTVRQAPLDTKRYKVIELRNGLKICLVSTCVHETSTPANDSVLFKSPFSYLFGSRDKTGSPSPPANKGKDPEFLENKIKFFNNTFFIKENGITRASKRASAPGPQDICPQLPAPPAKAPKLVKCCSKGPSTICVCVGAGSFKDPYNLNGLAHFVEHLIFLGSKQYPEPNTLFTKVFENGGAVNATTYAEYTNFYFQCKTRVFEECVSILVDSLTNPLFKKSTIQKEIEAVDSEYCIKMTHDVTRISDFLRNRARLGHPFKRFYWGNKMSLDKPCIFEQVRKWKERYYRANYMTVCIQAPMSIEDLERFALKHFSDIPSCPSDWESPTQQLLQYGQPYSEENFETAYFIVPLSHLNCIMLTWALPAKFWQNYETKPLDYIQYLLETTSKGGLKHYLRKKQWITEWSNLSINCCARDDYCRNSYCSMFTLSIFLTDSGYENNLAVIEAVFSYLKMLQRGGVRPHLYEEMQLNAATKFHYQNWEEMLQTGVDIAVNMQSVQNLSDLITSMNLMTKYDPELIEEALGLMTARSANYIFASRTNIPFCKDEAMPSKILFRKFDVYPQIYSTWEDAKIYGDFSLPAIGSFSPKEIHLDDGTGGGSEKEIGYKCIGTLFENNKLSVQYLSEKKIPCLSPRVASTSIFVIFTSPMVIGRTSRMKMAVMEYWTRLLNDRIVEKMGNQYDHLFNFEVICADDGIGVFVGGPRSHIVELLRLVVREVFGSFGEEDDLIAKNLKVDKVREYMNDIYDVESLSEDIRAYLKEDSRPCYFELRDELLDVSLEDGDLSRLIGRFRKRMMVHVEITGSMTTAEAHGIVQLLTGKSCGVVDYAAPIFMPFNTSRATKLPLGTSLIAVRAVHPAYVTSVVTNFYQMDGWDDDNVRTGQFVIILFHMLRRRFANQLRTVEQLGYTTRLVPMWDPNSGPVGIYAISYTHPQKFSIWHVDTRIDAFFRNFYQKSLRTEKVRTFLKKRFFADEDLDPLLEEFDNFFKDNLLKEGRNFRKLSVQIEAYIPGNKIPPKIQNMLTAQGDTEAGKEGSQGGKGKGKGLRDGSGDRESLIALYYLDVDDSYKSRMKRENIRMISNIGQFKRTLQLLPV